jgi:DNA-binding beta-propeller fold protein YncE
VTIGRSATLLMAMVLAVGCGPRTFRASSKPAPILTARAIAMPTGPSGRVSMDYLAYDRVHRRVWVPTGEAGAVVVLGVDDDRIATVEGFRTAETTWHGQTRTVGPSSATIGDGVVYVGDRADSSVCAVDAVSLRIASCVKLDSMPDGLAYVSSAKEVWVTTPRDEAIAILDAADPRSLRWKARIAVPGSPEGFAVDDARGVFYTNLEDKDRTLTIGLESRQVERTWQPACGDAGPRGLALDHGADLLFVACTDRVVLLDAGRDGARLSTLAVGDGVDNLDFVESRHELYVAAARAATLTVVRADAGRLAPAAIVATTVGARNAVVTDEGVAYVTDAGHGNVLVVAGEGAAAR